MGKFILFDDLEYVLDYHVLLYWFRNTYDDDGVTDVVFIDDMIPYNIPKLTKLHIEYKFNLPKYSIALVDELPVYPLRTRELIKIRVEFSNAGDANRYKITQPQSYAELLHIKNNPVLKNPDYLI